jgi:hypothetical protein
MGRPLPKTKLTKSATLPELRIQIKMAWVWDGGVMCFSPKMEEFRDFSGFIRYMEEQGAHKYGVAKVSSYVMMIPYAG